MFAEQCRSGRIPIPQRIEMEKNMLTSLAFIFLAGLAMAAVCERIGLPRIIGMLFTGIVLGPYVLNLLDPSILGISSELRQMALIKPCGFKESRTPCYDDGICTSEL